MKYARSDGPPGLDYVVERGVPLPKFNRWRHLAAEMSAADSVVVENLNQAISLCYAIGQEGGTSAKRQSGANYRVWRTT